MATNSRPILAGFLLARPPSNIAPGRPATLRPAGHIAPSRPSRHAQTLPTKIRANAFRLATTQSPVRNAHACILGHFLVFLGQLATGQANLLIQSVQESSRAKRGQKKEVFL